MARIPLLGGAYQSRSLIASAQESINLYSEKNPEDGSPPVPATCYPTPGLSLASLPPYVEGMRSLYRASNGALYSVIGPNVYSVSSAMVWALLGIIPDNTTPVNFTDNGLVIVVVDGSATGYAIDMTSNDFATISDPNFYGALSAAYQDTYFLFNRPGTAQFYISLSNATFDMLTGTVGEIYELSLTSDTTDGALLTGYVSTAGSGYTNGTYAGVALTGGTGSGALASITVASNAISVVTITRAGTGYRAGDTLSASGLGAGTGFVWTAVTVGMGYVDGSYSAVALSGGEGTNATADLTIEGGVVTDATLVAGGVSYEVGDVLSSTATTIGAGAVLTGSITTAGSGYTNGTYANVSLTGGAGTNAKAKIVVSGNAVTSVAITTPGSGYETSNVLSATAASIGGTGSGFSWTVSTIASGLVLDADAVHGAAFDSLDIASKSTADPIAALATVHGELWLIGELTTEPWYNAGAADFAYQRIQGAFVNHGCAAPYSVAQIDNSLLLLSQDLQGNGVVVMSDGYAFRQVSTHAIEQDIQSYSRIDDAIAYVYQEEGHAWYVLTFPTADKTWVYDIGAGQWHRRASIDGNGVLHRHRSSCYAFAYDMRLVGDYQNGNLYELSNAVYTDHGTPIPRIRDFPHLVEDGNRVTYRQFQADMAAGQITGGQTSSPPMASLSWSDDKGFTFGNQVTQSMGATGQYITSPNWQRLGMARDRVFRLSWAANANTALNGCWINVVKAAT